jgi:hypothetical protein
MIWSRYKICGYLLFYLAFAGTIVIVLGSINWVTYNRLASHGIEAQGTVTNTDCANHGVFSYRFSANGKVYEAKGTTGYGNPSCYVLNVGNSVIVYYLPENPAVSIPGNISPRLANETSTIFLAALISPLFAIFVLYFMLKIRKQ